MNWRGVRAKVLAARGSLREAETLAREGVAFAADVDMPAFAGDMFVDLAIVLGACGDEAGRVEALRSALERYERKGSRSSVRRAEALLAEAERP
jgi:hypothetical protein